MDDQMKVPHRGWYFLLCYMAYCAYTVDFAMRVSLQPQLMLMYHLDLKQMNSYYNIVYWGLITGVLAFGCLIDMFNIRTCFIWAFILQLLGLVKLLGVSPLIFSTPPLHQLKSGMFLTGVSEGAIFAIIHPLMAFIYNEPGQSKVKVISLLHTAWPFMLIASILFQQTLLIYQWDWYNSIYAMLIFPLIYLIMALFLPLPEKSFKHIIPISSRIKSTLRPGYFLLFFCMIFSTTIEQSPEVWIKNLLNKSFVSAVPFLIFGCAFQILGRLLAGPISQRLTPPGLLCLASILLMICLYILGHEQKTLLALIAAGLVAFSISFYWPTYLAIVADRYPLSSGFGLGLMNCGGYISMVLTIPELVRLSQKEGLSQAFLLLSWYSLLTVILLLAVFSFFRSQGGYKVFSFSDRSL